MHPHYIQRYNCVGSFPDCSCEPRKIVATFPSCNIPGQPSPTALDWLHRVAPCLGSREPQEDAPPGWPARPPPRLLLCATSSTRSSLTPLHQQDVSCDSGDEPWTPIFVPRSAASSVLLDAGQAHETPGGPSPDSPLFIPLRSPLLPAPGSTPPRPPTTRRNTLVGVTSFNLDRRSPCLRAKKRSMPIAQLEKRLL